MKASELAEGGKGLALVSLIVGLATGGALYAITHHWLDQSAAPALPAALMVLVVAFSAGWLLMAEKGDLLRPVLPAALIGLLLAAPTWWLINLSENDRGTELSDAPLTFWFLLAAPLCAFLMTVLGKSALQSRGALDYTAVFFHGVTLPIIAGGAKLFAGLAVLLLFAWANLLKSFDVTFFVELFDESWFMMPFFGAVGGLSIAMIRGLQSTLGALRYLLLLLSRLMTPIMAMFSLTFLAIVVIRGPAAIFEQDMLPGVAFGQSAAIMLGLAFVGMLLFNGVYQNGEGAPPPAWLRIANNICLLVFPVYAGLAAFAIFERVGAYGLTPLRIIAITLSFLAFAYSIVGFAGLITELNWRSKRWMPLVARLNIGMAVVWVVAMLAISSPLLNPWAMSARSQENLLLSQKITAEDFDYKFLRFKTGQWGKAALERLSTETAHPESAIIRERAAAALAAENRYSFEDPVIEEQAPEETEAMSPDIMDLPLNPENDMETGQATPEGDGL